MSNPIPCIPVEPIDDSNALQKLGSLTQRERDVITGICSGKSVREVAKSLGLAVSTTSNHRVKAYRKLNVHSAIQLMLWAFEAGLIQTSGSEQRRNYLLALRTIRS